MPEVPVPKPVDAFLHGVHPAVVASVRADGSPHSAATRYDREDGRVLLNMDARRRARRYTGEVYPNRTSPRTNAWIEVESWHGWDAAGAILTHAEWKDAPER